MKFLEGGMRIRSYELTSVWRYRKYYQTNIIKVLFGKKKTSRTLYS